MTPERLWKLVTSFIPPDLMDRYVFVVHPTVIATAPAYVGKSRTVLLINILLFDALPSCSNIPQSKFLDSTYLLLYIHPGLRGSSEVGRASLCSLCSRGLLPCFAPQSTTREFVETQMTGVSSGTM
jgi:hypothetical protein